MKDGLTTKTERKQNHMKSKVTHRFSEADLAATTSWLDDHSVPYEVSNLGVIVDGSVSVASNTTLNAPALAKVDGCVIVHEKAKLNAPAVKKESV